MRTVWFACVAWAVVASGTAKAQAPRGWGGEFAVALRELIADLSLRPNSLRALSAANSEGYTPVALARPFPQAQWIGIRMGNQPEAWVQLYSGADFDLATVWMDRLTTAVAATYPGTLSVPNIGDHRMARQFVHPTATLTARLEPASGAYQVFLHILTN